VYASGPFLPLLLTIIFLTTVTHLPTRRIQLTTATHSSHSSTTFTHHTCSLTHSFRPFEKNTKIHASTLALHRQPGLVQPLHCALLLPHLTLPHPTSSTGR